MMIKTVYSFTVLETMREGRTVYMIDKLNRTISKVNDLTVNEFMFIETLDDKEGRYEFYYIEQPEGVTENEII